MVVAERQTPETENVVVLRMPEQVAQVVGWALQHFVPVTAEPVKATEALDALRQLGVV